MEDKNTTKKSEAAIREETILQFWTENKIFEKSLDKKSPDGEYIFYEGPPTANGKPGIHHLEARAFKDAIPRYKTMRGFHVRRKGGWDTHGLAVEIQTEKKLGLNSKKAIEEYGVAKFNQECKESVWEYLDVWNKFTKRIGFWLDQDNPYVTYHNDYIESVWNIVKKVDDQKLLYKDYKVVPWCPRCGTALSSHELAQGYEDVKDLSVYVKFKIIGFPDAYFLAWTTTPWTLPGNVALAVGKDIIYVEIKVADEILVLAKDRLSIIEGSYEIIAEHKGKDMVGMQYEPLFPFLSDNIAEKSKLEKAYKIYVADFVNTVDGTGIVHTAVMYGQDDFELGTRVGLPKHHLVNLEGKFIKDTGFLEGRFVRETDPKGKPTLAVDIIEDLKKRNLFFKQENYKHSYPHCWRCHTALIYYARDSWYIRMSDPKIKKKLISENKKINWEPAYIRDGRFGEWLREIKDWAISRERYWGTPLPIWLNSDGEKIVVDSLETLKKYSKKSNNKYFIMRHGEAIDNAKHVFDPKGDPNNHLTDKGKEEILSTCQNLKKEKIDMIFASPFIRTRETAEIVKRELQLADNRLVIDERLHEFNESEESEVRIRMGEIIFELEKQHRGKKILIISHGNPLWVLEKIAAWHKSDDFSEYKMLQTAEVKELPFIPFPHDQNFELDLHRPFIDEIVLWEKDKEFRRVKEVMDVWLDSGVMPFAQDHYPFENKKWVDGKGYPADYICEAIDQTRGWFYTLHAVGVLMGRGRAYKNVICLGHLLDASGKKMSKSLGNVVDPWVMMEKYGVDTIRLWMYSVNQPGESKNFDEKTITLLHQQVFGLLYNVLAFYELYRDKNLEKDAKVKSKNILDQWILTELAKLVELTTENLDNYKLLEPVRGIRDFIGDLSTWYLRRSRDRIKEGAANPANEDGARQTLYFVLKTLAKIMAPFAPFTAEDIWLKLKNKDDLESVHLAEWPRAGKIKSKIIEEMKNVREIVSLGLKERQKALLPVRQPLAKLEVKDLDLGKEYIELIKDELNVKEVRQNKNIEADVAIDKVITLELKDEGRYRELSRAIQEMRKEIKLTPSDVISIAFETSEEGKKLIQKFETDMKKTVLVSKIEFEENNGLEIKISDLVFRVKIKK